MTTATLTNEYNNATLNSRMMHENNDCAVKAISIAAGVDYLHAHSILKSLGRVDGKGTYTYQIEKAFCQLGFKLIRVTTEEMKAQYPKNGTHLAKMKCLTTFHPARFTEAWSTGGKVFIAYTKGHVLAIKGGMTHCYTATKPKRIIALYQVVKA